MKKTIQRLYIAILLFAPLAFGTAETWSKTLLNGAVFLSAFLFFIHARLRKKPLFEVPGIIALLGLLGVIVLQMVPLPAFVVKIISPATYNLWRGTVGLTEPVQWMRLSVDLKATLLNGVQFSAYLLFFVLSIQLLSHGDFLKKVVRIIIWFGAGLAFVAILQHFSMPGKIFWFRETLGGGGFGPYANRNHYAGFMIMLFPMAFCMLLYNKPRVSYSTWREKISEFFSYRGTNVYLLMLLAVLLMGSSVFVSLSRGGIVSLCLALILLGISIAFKTRAGRGRGVMVATLFGMLLISVGWFGWDPIFARFSQIRNAEGDISESRIPAWRDSMDIIKTFPFAGTGAGTFFHAHKAFRNATPGHGFFVHAHNDYIETASDLGIIGLGCFLAFVMAVASSFKRFRQRNDSYSIYLFLGAITAFTAILIHSLVEFNLQIGANALYFFFIAALCVAAANTRLRASGVVTFLEKYRRPWIKPAFLAASGLLLIGGTALNCGAYLGELHFNNVMQYYDKPVMEDPDYENIQKRSLKAAIFDPFESQNYVILANALSSRGEDEAALSNYGKAIKINPMNGDYLQAKADLYDRTGQRELAEKFHQSALKYEGANPRIHANYGFWLMTSGDFDKGAEEMRRAISLSPGLTRNFISRLASLDLSYDQLVTALPARVEPYIVLGEYLVEMGQEDLALRAYATAYGNLANEEVIKAYLFQRIYSFYIKHDLVDKAFQAVAAGVAYLPNDSSLRYTMGTLYERIGIPYRAVEEYEQAIILNPKNAAARKQLERLKEQS